VTHLSRVTEKGTGTVKYQPKLHSQRNVLIVIYLHQNKYYFYYLFIFCFLHWL